MIDRDLAVLYEVETKILNKAVRRNIERFPSDFMFQLTKDEFDNLKFQFGTSSWGGTRKLPLVFTENVSGVASTLFRIICNGRVDRGNFPLSLPQIRT